MQLGRSITIIPASLHHPTITTLIGTNAIQSHVNLLTKKQPLWYATRKVRELCVYHLFNNYNYSMRCGVLGSHFVDEETETQSVLLAWQRSRDLW